jgi:hypothetical protein
VRIRRSIVKKLALFQRERVANAGACQCTAESTSQIG